MSPSAAQTGVAIRGVHLDLKDLAPTSRRLAEFLDVFTEAGYNLLLSSGRTRTHGRSMNASAPRTAYTPSDIAAFAAAAAERGLEIVPLVQCLGYMEKFLAPAEYRWMSEDERHADTLNLLAGGATDLVAGLIDDVLRLTLNVHYLHLGLAAIEAEIESLMKACARLS